MNGFGKGGGGWAFVLARPLHALITLAHVLVCMPALGRVLVFSGGDIGGVRE